jgi:hypothetical protein
LNSNVGAHHDAPNFKAEGKTPKSRARRDVPLRAKLKANKDNDNIKWQKR